MIARGQISKPQLDLPKEEKQLDLPGVKPQLDLPKEEKPLDLPITRAQLDLPKEDKPLNLPYEEKIARPNTDVKINSLQND